MKKIYCFMAFSLAWLMAISVSADSEKRMLPIEDALAVGEKVVGTDGLDDSTQFYFGQQEYPPISNHIKSLHAGAKATVAAHNVDAACNAAFRIVLFKFQKAANKLEADAVVNIQSFGKRSKASPTSSNTEFECYFDGKTSIVYLKGELIQTAEKTDAIDPTGSAKIIFTSLSQTYMVKYLLSTNEAACEGFKPVGNVFNSNGTEPTGTTSAISKLVNNMNVGVKKSKTRREKKVLPNQAIQVLGMATSGNSRCGPLAFRFTPQASHTYLVASDTSIVDKESGCTMRILDITDQLTQKDVDDAKPLTCRKRFIWSDYHSVK